MPRPQIPRRVRGNPNSTYFKPAGIPLRELEEVILNMAEFEAIRLADVEGVSQSEAAEKMLISQPTYSRILDSARKKLADAIIKGKGIRLDKIKTQD